jgi:2-amino-4-hydroxy-6-hydroxymethyldihydropteridine diphosphokinase
VKTSGHVWRPVYIGLGSNLDSPGRQIETAFELLDGVPDTRLIARSSLYRSAPFGGIEQADFVNAVAALLTRLSAVQLLAQLQEIERVRGRERGGVRWGPRVLDLDLLVYSYERVDEPDLTVPHPGIAERNFVLLPLRELAPDLVIPGLGRVRKIAVNKHEPRISRIA